MIAAMGDDNLLALLIGKKVNAQHFAAGPPPGRAGFGGGLLGSGFFFAMGPLFFS